MLNIKNLSARLCSSDTILYLEQEIGKGNPLITTGVFQCIGDAPRMRCTYCEEMIDCRATPIICPSCGQIIVVDKKPKAYTFNEAKLVNVLCHSLDMFRPNKREDGFWNLGTKQKQTIYYVQNFTARQYSLMFGKENSIIISGAKTYEENEAWNGRVLPIYEVIDIVDGDIRLVTDYFNTPPAYPPYPTTSTQKKKRKNSALKYKNLIEMFCQLQIEAQQKTGIYTKISEPAERCVEWLESQGHKISISQFYKDLQKMQDPNSQEYSPGVELLWKIIKDPVAIRDYDKKKFKEACKKFIQSSVGASQHSEALENEKNVKGEITYRSSRCRDFTGDDEPLYGDNN